MEPALNMLHDPGFPFPTAAQPDGYETSALPGFYIDAQDGQDLADWQWLNEQPSAAFNRIVNLWHQLECPSDGRRHPRVVLQVGVRR